MEVRVRCFASLRDVAADRFTLTLPEGSKVADAWSAAVKRFPGLARHADFVRAARNASYAGLGAELHDGDEVAFMPPVSGGQRRAWLSGDPLDVGALEADVELSHGAVVTFVGRARSMADDGREVVELEYEAYAEMAESVLDDIAAEAEARWAPARVRVAHRVGRVPLGEAAVAIVASAPHRAEAYEASRHVIEEVKRRLPIWKRERFPDGTEWKRPGA
jgi:molybdopterin synthase catalytic subunit/molybdopterin converting factor small subunit